MKNILNSKKCLDNLSVISNEIDDIKNFLEAFYGEDYSDDKCDTCNDNSVGLSVYHYLINQIKSNELDIIEKMYSIFGDDLLVIIDGGLLNKEDILTRKVSFKKKKMPSLWFSIKTFLKSVPKVLFSSLRKGDGFFADKKTQKQRLSICKTCIQYQEGRCLLCTCYMKHKVKLKHAQCADEENKKW